MVPPKGGIKGSVSKLATYLEKEGQGELFYNEQINIPKHEVVHNMDKNKTKLSKDDAKFFHTKIKYTNIKPFKKLKCFFYPSFISYLT